MKRFIILGIVCLLSLLQGHIKAKGLDSLLRALPHAEEDTNKAKLYQLISWEYKGMHSDSAIYYAELGEALARRLGSGSLTEACLNSLGVIHATIAEYEKALGYFKKTYELNDSLGYLAGMAVSLNNQGLVHYYKSDIEEAIECYLKAIEIQNKIDNKAQLADSYSNLGLIYEAQSLNEEALEFYLKSLKLRQISGDKRLLAISYGNIGNIYFKREDNVEALSYWLKAERLFKEINDITSVGLIAVNLGSVYAKDNQHALAIDYFRNGMNIQKMVGDQWGLCINLHQLALSFQAIRQKDSAKIYVHESLHIAQSIGSKQNILDAAELLSTLYGDEKNFELAYKYNAMYADYLDSLHNESSTSHIEELEKKFESELKEREISKLTLQQSADEARHEKNMIAIWAISGGLILCFVLAIFILKSYRDKRVAFDLLEEKNFKILDQKAIIEEKNKDITDSILYAKRIQEAILPTDDYLAGVTPEHFVYFKPRDIVSGDFYWVYQSADHKLVWCVADCTGHGVPGAFMSMIGNSLLNEIVIEKGITNSDEILNELRKGVINALHQRGEIKEVTMDTVKDGMDIALCVWDKESNTLEFSGANNPLWLFRKTIDNSGNGFEDLSAKAFNVNEDNGYKFLEIKGDRQPVGLFAGEPMPFSRNTIKLLAQDVVYIFTDGYPDQFGGMKGKKFKYSKMKELLFNKQGEDLATQKDILQTTFVSWQGEQVQVDDVCIIGIRV